MFLQDGSTWVKARRIGPTLLVLASVLLGAATRTTAQSDAELERAKRLFLSIQWKDGPCKADMGPMAQIAVPAGCRSCNAENVQKLLEVNGNPPERACVGALVPSDSLDWTLYFSFDPCGYVKDDEKAELDEATVAQILDQFRAGTEAGNKERLKRGWPTLRIIGWAQPPKYDDGLKKMTWATRCESEGHESVNYDVRLLGRSGVMHVKLVTDPAQLQGTLPMVKGVLSGFQFTPGNTYAEWHAGDKVAEYGLIGLIGGGVLWKTGLLAKLGKFFVAAWKLLVVAGAAVFAWLSRLLSRKKPGTNANA